MLRRFSLGKLLRYKSLLHDSMKCALPVTCQCMYSSSSKSTEIDVASYPLERIRNFCIIAHVDHGKSTLADRILEYTGAINKNASNKQVLDKLQVEKDRGITVKAQSASIAVTHNGENYLLNLIDTPGHVDFVHEVSRSLSACDGVLLIIDAVQGVQAQTVANFYQAFAKDLAVVPVINKIDLKTANVEMVGDQLLTLFEIDPDEALKVSAKLGIGIKEVLEAVIERIPPPKQPQHETFSALIYDAWYEGLKGTATQIIVKSGTVKKGDSIEACHTRKNYDVRSVGILTPELQIVDKLFPGQVGVITAGIKKTSDIHMGDTFRSKGSKVTPLEKFELAKPMVFAGVYPVEHSELPELTSAINKLTLNDPSVSVQIESSDFLGNGWRLGFLGLLHMDVFNQRLDSEYNAQVIMTTPSVTYKVKIKGEKGEEIVLIKNPSQWPKPEHIIETYEPMVKATIVTPNEYYSKIEDFCVTRRGEEIDVNHSEEHRKLIYYKLPLSEVLIDFFDVLKSLSSGYASFDYEDMGFETRELVKLEMQINGKIIHEFSTIVPKDMAQAAGRKICLKLKDHLPRQHFMVPIQAKVGSVILARESLKAFKKDVTSKCYGGDSTRKMKLLRRQAEGSKRLKSVANIQIPHDTFVNVIRK